MEKQVEDINNLIEIAYNRRTSPKILEELAKNENWEVRKGVALIRELHQKHLLC